jgi:hypothetical protein
MIEGTADNYEAHQMLNGGALVCALIGHLVGDYLLQNDWMALNKKKPGGKWHCAVHATIWTLCVCMFTGWWSTAAWGVLWATHYWQDRTNIIVWWMKFMGQEKFMKSGSVDSELIYSNRPEVFDKRRYSVRSEFTPGLGPWSIIVVDNVWHIVTLFLVWRWVA